MRRKWASGKGQQIREGKCRARAQFSVAGPVHLATMPGGGTESLAPDHSLHVGGGSKLLAVQLIRQQSHEPQWTEGKRDLAIGWPRRRYAHTAIYSLMVCRKERSFFHKVDEFTRTQTDAYRFRNDWCSLIIIPIPIPVVFKH